jgi:hypothetical protein
LGKFLVFKVSTGRHFHEVLVSIIRFSVPTVISGCGSMSIRRDRLWTWPEAQDIEFEWDDENRKHLAAHKVTVAEFE